MAQSKGRSEIAGGNVAAFSTAPAGDCGILRASSRMAAGERNRTDAFDLCRTCEDASGSSEEGARGIKTAVLAVVFAAATLFSAAPSAQVAFKVVNDPAPAAAGVKYPTIDACNQTNSPQLVEGWKFRTRNFSGYTQGWVGTLTNQAGPPVEYNQAIDPNQGIQMQTGTCRPAPVDYRGDVPAGQDGTIYDLQSLIKTGSCSEQPTYKDADPTSCAALTAPMPAPFYADQCLVDSLGINGGDNFGGLVSTFNGQTQILQALPTATTFVNGMNIKWDPRSLGGPQYMMSLAMAQELLNVDMQFIAAIGGKETMFGFVEQGKEAQGSISEWANFNIDNDHVYSPWEIEIMTFARTMQSYPQFFPKYGPCMGKFRDVTSAGDCSGDFGLWDTPAAYYMHTPGTKGTGPNSPQLANSILSSTLVWYWLYDGLVQSTDLCFVDAISNGKDTRLALAALIPGYNLGPNSGFQAPLKDPALKNDPNASARFAEGNGSYRTNVFKLIDHMIDASRKSVLCGGTNPIYDADIGSAEMQRFFFGGSATPGTPEAQGDGGLLLHFDLSLQQRKDLLADLNCAYGKLKGAAPSTKGKDAISYRYDWLTLLRVAKNYLPSRHRLIPVQSDFRLMVDAYNKSPTTCTGKSLDKTYPSMTITAPAQNTVMVPNNKPGTVVAFTGKDNVAVARGEWTFDKNWVVWNPATKTPAGHFEVVINCERPDYPAAKGAKAALWVRTTDDCGNSTVQQLDFTTHSTANCGDPPVPPQVATPLATPTGREFSALSPGVNVTLTVATPGASILYTTDGTEPDSAVRGATKRFAGPIPILGTTILKARGVMDGMSASTVMTETYTKVEPGKVATPAANPFGRNFTGTLSVTLSSATAGATIFYTLDGSIPDSSGAGAIRYTIPVVLVGNATLNAIAVKEGMYKSALLTEKYTAIPPVAVKHAWYLDRNGDGRIDRAIVEFASALPAVPAKFAFKIVDEDGKETLRTPAGAEITLAPGDAMRAVIVFAEPFPANVTSLKNGATSGQTFRQDAIPLDDGVFAVADSAAPVIVKAGVKEPGDGGALKRVIVTYSEPVTVAAGGQPLVFKRGASETPGSAVILANTEKSGDRAYIFHVDSNSSFFPIVGDSVAIAINGRTTDALGRSPTAKLFRVLEGVPPKPKPVTLRITFPNGSQQNPSSGSAAGNVNALFIPVDQAGNALPGSVSDGKCQGCVARDGAGFVGPVFHIITPGPVSYEFKIFNNVGEFVAEGKGRIDENDLKTLKKSNDASGVNYEAPIVWTGGTRNGGKAGTGAYILKAGFISEKDFTSGAGPGTFSEKKVFGLLRGCCGS